MYLLCDSAPLGHRDHIKRTSSKITQAVTERPALQGPLWGLWPPPTQNTPLHSPGACKGPGDSRFLPMKPRHQRGLFQPPAAHRVLSELQPEASSNTALGAGRTRTSSSTREGGRGKPLFPGALRQGGEDHHQATCPTPEPSLWLRADHPRTAKGNQSLSCPRVLAHG